MKINPAIRKRYEMEIDLSLDLLPSHGITVFESQKRLSKNNEEFKAIRLNNNDGVLVSTTTRINKVLQPQLSQMTSSELFSDFGCDFLCRKITPGYTNSHSDICFVEYYLSDIKDFVSFHKDFTIDTLMKSDITWAVDQFRLRLNPGDDSPPEDKIWAFVCIPDGIHSSIAVLNWNQELNIGGISIAGTDEEIQNKGYGRAVVSAATEYILNQGYIATYGTTKVNTIPIRMIWPIGYRHAGDEIYIKTSDLQ